MQHNGTSVAFAERLNPVPPTALWPRGWDPLVEWALRGIARSLVPASQPRFHVSHLASRPIDASASRKIIDPIREFKLGSGTHSDFSKAFRTYLKMVAIDARESGSDRLGHADEAVAVEELPAKLLLGWID